MCGALHTITEFTDCQIRLDLPRCTADKSFNEMSKTWNDLTVTGMLAMLKVDHDEVNMQSSSSFHMPIYKFHANKQSDEIMHLSQGHMAQFISSITDSMADHMKDCA